MTGMEARLRLPIKGSSWVVGGISLVVILLVAWLLLAPRDVVPQIGILTQAGVARLPHLNAGLNGASAILLTCGYILIRSRKIKLHRFCMLSAFGLSAGFLISYLIYHTATGPTPFTGHDWLRPVYLAVLISHIILAIVVLPLALTTLYRGLAGSFGGHRRIARWTWPIWLYVSVSGVVVYLMLHII